MRKCPFCAEEIQDEAIKCKHCGEMLSEPSQATAKEAVPSKGSVCPRCGFHGRPKKAVQGSCLVEGVLWLLLLIPGIIYTIWRLASKREVCPKCGAPNMIPAESSEGQKILTSRQQA